MEPRRSHRGATEEPCFKFPFLMKEGRLWPKRGEALGELPNDVEVEPLIDDAASSSRIDTPLWDSLERAITKPFPAARLSPQFIVGFSDSRIYREKGSVSYGAGLMSPSVSAGEFERRFHGHDERIDVESLRLTTGMYLDVCEDLLG